MPLKFISLSMLIAITATPLLAREYSCAPWSPSKNNVPNITELSVGKSMITFKEGKLRLTARMAYGTLRRNTYNDENSVIIIHGKPVKSTNGTVGFGKKITLQRLYHDPQRPIFVQTTCKGLK